MTLGIAVLGTGRIVETGYVPAFAEVGDARLVAILSRDQARSDAFAKKHDIPAAYADLDALLADPAVDAVIVATPDLTHEAQVIAAAKAGKHILCEKPMAIDLAACARMADAVGASGVTFAMGYDNRFNAGLRRIKEMIEAGEVGPVLYAHTLLTTAVSDPNNWRAAGEQSRYWAMSASGTHVIDIYRWYFGEPEKAGGAFISPVYNSKKDEISTVILNYSGRLMASLTVASVLPEGNRIEIHGEKGSIIGTKVFGRKNPQAFLTVKGREFAVDQRDPFINEIEDFVAAIRTGRPPLSGLEDGVRNVAIMQRAWEADSLRPI